MNDRLARGRGHEERMLIDGQLVLAGGGKTFDNVNPATEQVIGTVADAALADVDRAIGAARRSFDQTNWCLDRDFRRRCLEQLRDALDAEREQLRDEIVEEVGCTISSTYTSRLDPPLDRSFAWFIKMIDDFTWERDEGAAESAAVLSQRVVFKESIGVVGAITAWNSPVELALAKLVPALAAGNTVVLKPAPDTPFTTTRLGRLIHERTDIPPGVVNIVTARSNLIGEMLTTDPRIDMISFTGSLATGRKVMRNSAETLKRLQLELGGKAPHVVLDDADLGRAIRTSMNICLNAGQSCGALSRLLLPRSLYSRGIEMVEAAFKAVRVGDPTDPDISMGPLANQAQRRTVLAAIQRGISDGAKLLIGGSVPPGLPVGYFMEPTCFIDVDPRLKIAQDEVFGPVLCVIPYEDEDEAVEIANGTPYGLSAAISSASDSRASAVAARLRVGSISINGGSSFARDVPFGGYKLSGVGRQNGIEGFEEMLETKTVGLPVGSRDRTTKLWHRRIISTSSSSALDLQEDLSLRACQRTRRARSCCLRLGPTSRMRPATRRRSSRSAPLSARVASAMARPRRISTGATSPSRYLIGASSSPEASWSVAAR
jgi:aldehyde dehydrogenase (NAD+)